MKTENMQDSVWLVEQGTYSDYSVEAIFSTEKQAREFCSHLPDSEPREWVLNTWADHQISFTFWFDLMGNIVQTEEEAFVKDLPAESNIHSDRQERERIRIHVNRGPRDLAIKIASEHYTKIRAFLDEAQKRVDRAKYNKISDDYCCNDALEAAKILAGINQAPNPPECGHDKNILTILSISEKSE